MISRFRRTAKIGLKRLSLTKHDSLSPEIDAITPIEVQTDIAYFCLEAPQLSDAGKWAIPVNPLPISPVPEMPYDARIDGDSSPCPDSPDTIDESKYVGETEIELSPQALNEKEEREIYSEDYMDHGGYNYEEEPLRHSPKTPPKSSSNSSRSQSSKFTSPERAKMPALPSPPPPHTASPNLKHAFAKGVRFGNSVRNGLDAENAKDEVYYRGAKWKLWPCFCHLQGEGGRICNGWSWRPDHRPTFDPWSGKREYGNG